MFRIIAAVRDLLILLAVTAGPPFVLTAVAGPPIPQHAPSATVLRAWLDDPLQPAFAAATARTTAWLLWAAYTTVILIFAAVRLRHLPARLRRMTAYLPPPMQGLTATVLGAAAVTCTTAPPPAAAAPAGITDTTVPTIRPIVADPAPTSVGTDTAARDAATPTPHVTRGNAPRQPARSSPHRVVCTVRAGDTLFDIAGQRLGDSDRWPEIFALNKGTRFPRTGGTLTNPDLIYPGWTLRLPETRTPPAPPTPRAPTDAALTPGRHDVTSTPRPATPSPGLIAPTGRTADTAPPAHPAQSSSTPAAASPAPFSPSTPAPGAETTHHDDLDQGGIDLGDHGWVAAEVAAAVSAAVALLWIHRRRRYRPRPLGQRRDDIDLSPQPAPVAALHRHTRPAEDNDMNQPPTHLPEATRTTAVTLGTHPDHSPVRVPELTAHGVGLTGPGAPAAARGVLAAALSAGGPWASHAEATIITTRTDLDQLLDGATPPDIDRLHIVGDTLTAAETHLLHRARTTGTDDDEPQPEPAPTVILTAAPTGRDADRLAAILTVGARLGITAILTGTWPHGDTWTVADDGTTTAGDPSQPRPRLNVLDTSATVAILDTVSQARPPDTDPSGSEPAGLQPTVHHPPTQPGASTRATSVPAQPPAVTPPSAGRPLPATDPVTTGTASGDVTDERPLHVNVLGRPRIEVLSPHGRTELRIRRSDGIEILIYLAAEPDGATSDQIMAALWPEIRPRYARGRFHTTMSELRAQLRDAIAADAIVRTGDRYHLDPDKAHVDLWQLRDAIDHARLTLEPAAHTAALHDVITTYTATIADGHHWLWLAAHRETIRQHILDAHVELADQQTDPRTALAHIQNAISVDPYNEDLYRRAMHQHAKLGNTDGIRRTLRAVSQRLTELEINVSPQTQQAATDLITRLDARHRITRAA